MCVSECADVAVFSPSVIKALLSGLSGSGAEAELQCFSSVTWLNLELHTAGPVFTDTCDHVCVCLFIRDLESHPSVIPAGVFVLLPEDDEGVYAVPHRTCEKPEDLPEGEMNRIPAAEQHSEKQHMAK